LVSHYKGIEWVKGFENMLLRKIFGPRGEEGNRGPGEEELHDFFFSPNIFRVIKSRRMRWVGHLARMGERSVQSFRREI
jgi:hypothetical protein